MDPMGVRKDLHSYSIYMDIMCKSGKPWKAVKLYKEMKKKGIRYKEAYELLDRMHEKGCVPDVITFNCIFRCLEKPREILRLLDRMIESRVHPRMDTYVVLLRKFGRWGFLRPAFIVWEKMEELGCSPDESAYNALVDKGMVDMARKYDEEMLAKGLSAKPREELGTKLERNMNRTARDKAAVICGRVDKSWLLKQIIVCKLLVLGGSSIGNNQEWGFQNISGKSFDINTRIAYLIVTVDAVAAREGISFVEGGAWKVI
uniref:Pentatricopeptide repeat-containing protein n=1 Tax=Quercus lobata TaxID=97700 RepID=A0A7N2MZP3_QUELO